MHASQIKKELEDEKSLKTNKKEQQKLKKPIENVFKNFPELEMLS
jgi:hypothetical protein